MQEARSKSAEMLNRTTPSTPLPPSSYQPTMLVVSASCCDLGCGVVLPGYTSAGSRPDVAGAVAAWEANLGYRHQLVK